MEATLTVDTKGLQQAAEIAEEAVRSGGHPTAVITVANAEETLWSHVVPGQDNAKIESIFLLASITKPITATAVMQMVERGRLLLSDPVIKYVPEFGKHGKEHVTVFHLLTHTSGLAEEWVWQQMQTVSQPSHHELVKAACESYLQFEPGTNYQYCSLSFSILAEIVSRLTGLRFAEYLSKYVFEPLGMQHTSFAPADRTLAMPVHDFGSEEQLEGFIRMEVAGGGLWSTASDMVKFGQAFLRGGQLNGYRLLSPPAVNTMTRLYTHGMKEVTPEGQRDAAYALGWGKRRNDADLLGSEEMFMHGGATGTLLAIDPKWQLVFVYLTNRWGVEHDTARKILNAVYGSIT